MSQASDNPVPCARAEDLGCTASHPGSKFDKIKAAAAGWFEMKDGTAYCPPHVPDWVPAWRAKQAAKQRERASA